MIKKLQEHSLEEEEKRLLIIIREINELKDKYMSKLPESDRTDFFNKCVDIVNMAVQERYDLEDWAKKLQINLGDELQGIRSLVAEMVGQNTTYN